MTEKARSLFDWNTGARSVMAKYAAQMEKTQKGVASMVKQRKQQGHSFYQDPEEKPFQTYSHAKPSVFNGSKK